MDIEAIYRLLEGITAENVYAAYKKVLSAYNIISVGTVLGVAVSMFLFFKTASESALAAIGYKNGNFTNKPSWAKMLEIFRPLGYILLIVIAYPHVLDQIEMLLTGVKDFLGNEIAPESNMKEIWKKEAETYRNLLSETSSWEFGKKIFMIVNFYLIMTVKPFLIVLEQDAYSLFLALRYLHLMILELFGGVALALYLSKETRIYTYSWLKHMLFNYAMVGVFGMADMFTNTIMAIYIDSNSAFSYNIVVIMFGAVMKLFLFRKSYSILQGQVF